MRFRSKAGQMATLGILAACAMVLSYIERWIPLPGLPGVRWGLANIAVLLAIYLLNARWALVISLVRVLSVGLLFTGIMAMAYSLAGALCSWAGMAVLARNDKTGMVLVSGVGGMLHNVAQLVVAAWVLGPGVWGYLPVLLLTGLVAGCINGSVAWPVIRHMRALRDNH